MANKALPVESWLKNNRYPGRGIIIGRTEDGKRAFVAYFIMGRSENSRNRVFTELKDEVVTEPYDVSRVEDPSLIIYTAVKQLESYLIVTNGDQTDTIAEGLLEGLSFSKSLKKRRFEPDAPHFTPRISGLLKLSYGNFSYQISILKSMDEAGEHCERFTFAYPSMSGRGHLIHTYMEDGNPLPSFEGEPRQVQICNDIDTMTRSIWDALDHDNRISLYTRMIPLFDGDDESRVINQRTEELK